MDPAPLTDATAGTITIGDYEVRRMGYGAMRLTGSGVWGPPPDPMAAIALLRHAVERGVNFIDTAMAYGPGDNEKIIAAALDPFDDIVVATKGGLARSGPGSWEAAGDPLTLRRECEASLINLGMDTVPLYQLHTPDPEVPFSDQVGALALLKNEGKIQNIGLSNVSAAQLAEARAITTIASVQNRYNVREREQDDVLTACEDAGIAFIPWYPLAPEAGFGSFDVPLGEIAAAHTTGIRAVALAWLLARSSVMLPIPGTSSQTHFDENLSAAFLTLSDAEVDRLNAHRTGLGLGGLLGQLDSGPLQEEGRAKLAPSTSRLSKIWNRLRFWD